MPVRSINELTHCPTTTMPSSNATAVNAEPSVARMVPVSSRGAGSVGRSVAADCDVVRVDPRSPSVRINRTTRGPPTSPPSTMPAVALATAIAPAPTTPACSKSGAKAAPVAGPPVRVTAPTSTPNSGGRPNIAATAMPTTLCSTANPLQSARKTSTWGPPRRSSSSRAAKPRVAKNATNSGFCNKVSKVRTGPPSDLLPSNNSATNSPPTTGGGMLKRSRTPTLEQSHWPANTTAPASASVCMKSSVTRHLLKRPLISMTDHRATPAEAPTWPEPPPTRPQRSNRGRSRRRCPIVLHRPRSAAYG